MVMSVRAVLFVSSLAAVLCVARNDPLSTQGYRPAQDSSSPVSPMWNPGSTHRAALGLRRSSRRSSTRMPTKPLSASSPQQPQQQQPADGAEPNDATRRLVQLAFLHRHGARTPPVVVDDELSWALCHLSTTGAAMARNLGRTLRQWYGSFLGEVYDPNKFVTLSTDVERTIRTAYGVIDGAFNRTDGSGNTWSVPLIHHAIRSHDSLMGFYYTWGAAVLHSPVFRTYNPDTADQTLSYINSTELQTLGALTNSSNVCDDPKRATTCALFTEDVGTCRRSNEGLSPAYRSLLTPEKLLRAGADSFWYLYGTEFHRPLYERTGPYGMLWVTTVLDAFEASIDEVLNNDQQSVANVPVLHYSAHDNTVFGVLVALGAVNTSTTDIKQRLPMFTSVIRLELYSDRSVTFKYSTCEQEHDSDYHYTDDPHALLNCQRADGSRYSSVTCPMVDLRRYLNSVLNTTTSDDPMCDAVPADVKAADCAPWSSEANQPVSEVCASFRNLCPAHACDPRRITTPNPPAGVESSRYVLDRSASMCRSAYDLHGQKASPAPTVIYIVFAFAAFIGTILVGLGVVYMFQRSREREGSLLGDKDEPYTDTQKPPTAANDLA